MLKSSKIKETKIDWFDLILVEENIIKLYYKKNIDVTQAVELGTYILQECNFMLHQCLYFLLLFTYIIYVDSFLCDKAV